MNGSGDGPSTPMGTALPDDPFQVSKALQMYMSKTGKNVISVFGELFQSTFKTSPDIRVITLKSEQNIIKFKGVVELDGRVIEGVPQFNKRNAKESCCRRAAQYMFESYGQQNFVLSEIEFQKDDTLFEMMRQMTYSKFCNKSQGSGTSTIPSTSRNAKVPTLNSDSNSYTFSKPNQDLQPADGSETKNVISQFYEFFQSIFKTNPIVTVSERNSHFQAEINIDNTIIKGSRELNKVNAKKSCCRKAVQFLLKNYNRKSSMSRFLNAGCGGSANNSLTTKANSTNSGLKFTANVLSNEFSRDSSEALQTYMSKTGKSVISVFCEFYQSIFKTSPEMRIRTIDGKFQCFTLVDKRMIKGRAESNKLNAKESCCERASKYLLDTFYHHKFTFNDIVFGRGDTLFELMRQMTYSKFSKLASEDIRLSNTDMVISSIFMYNNSDDTLTLVSLATGNKCISGDALSLNGSAVHDSHAEILARRGLLRFFYSQILLFLRDRSRSIFSYNSFIDKLIIRECLSFHQFINTAPCGDARVYFSGGSRKENDNGNAGKVRYKIEKGMGTVLGETSCLPPQSVDGILGGERLRVMSCSDKIMKWNVLGLQGALLSNLLHPIYLSSLIVDEFFDEERLKRAVYGRVEKLEVLLPFRVSLPLLKTCQKYVVVNSPRNSQISCNWNVADGTAEVTDTSTGDALDDTSEGENRSRICRKELTALFRKVCKEMEAALPSAITYESVKASSDIYEENRIRFEKLLMESGAGQWQSLPDDISKFPV